MRRIGGIPWPVLAALVVLPPLAVVGAMAWERIHVPDTVKLILLLAGATLFALWRAVSSLGDARRIEDQPTARIASAAQGYVELEGTADGPGAACAIAGAHCVWSDGSVEKKGLFDKKASTVLAWTDSEPFVLRDATGECVVFPRAARVITAQDYAWYGSQARPPYIPGAAARWIRRLACAPVFHGFAPVLLGLGIAAVAWLERGAGPAVAVTVVASGLYYLAASLLGCYRYRLRLIRPGEHVYALGSFSTEERDGGQPVHRLAAAPGEDRPFIVSTRSQADLVRGWRRRVLPWFVIFVILLALTGQAMRSYL